MVPFQCPYCSNSFGNKRSRATHISKAHYAHFQVGPLISYAEEPPPDHPPPVAAAAAADEDDPDDPEYPAADQVSTNSDEDIPSARRVTRRISSASAAGASPPAPSQPSVAATSPAPLVVGNPSPPQPVEPQGIVPGSAPFEHVVLGERVATSNTTNMKVDSIHMHDRYMGRLYKICDDAGAAKYLCDEFLDAIRDATSNGFDLNSALLTRRRSFMPKIQKQLGLQKPESIPVTLESGEKVVVHRFHYLDLLKEHLISPVFAELHNLDLPDPNDPWSVFPANAAPTYESPASSDWYREYVKHQDEEIPNLASEWMIHPLTLYIDKTGADGIMKNTLEPLVCTSSLLSQKCRQDCTNYIILGHIPDTDRSSAPKRRALKMHTRDFHRCLRILLDPLIKLQKECPPIQFRRGKETAWYRGLFPVQTIMGDNLSSNKLCGRVNNNTRGSPRMCRCCLTPYGETDTIPHECKPINPALIQKLSSAALGCDYGSQGQSHPAALSVNLEAWDDFVNGHSTKSERDVLRKFLTLRKQISARVLKSVYGCHVVDNALNEVDFGPGGSVESATVSDIMHSVEEGLVKLILQIVLGVMTPKQKEAVDALVEKIFSSANSI